MARLHFVKKARKDNPVCKQGESYWWWAFMVGGRGGPKHYSKDRPKASQLTQSEFLGAMMDIADELSTLSADDSLESMVEDIVGRIRELGEEQKSKFDNMPESFQQGDTGQLLESRAEKCEEIAGEFEAITYDVSDKDDGESDEDFWNAKLEEVQGVDISTD